MIKNLGIRATFIEIAYIFGSLGAFWGTALTIEYNCKIWWDSNIKIKALMLGTNLIFSTVILIPFSINLFY